MPLFLQLLEQHLLMTQPIGEQLLVQLAYLWFVALKQFASFQLLPPRPDQWADAEHRQLAWCDQAGGHEFIVEPLIFFDIPQLRESF